MTDGGDEAGKLADSSSGLSVHHAHKSTQLHLQTDVRSEMDGKTKTATDAAGDGEEDTACS